MMLFCDDRAAAFWFCMAELTTGSPRESYDRRETALRLSRNPNNRSNFTAKVDMSRNWSATIRLPNDFKI